MGYSAEFELEIEVEGEFTDEDVGRLKAKIGDDPDLYGMSGYARKDKKGAYFSAQGTTGGGLEEWGTTQAKRIMRILGPCHITFAYYYRERDPDDSQYFDPDDYADLVPALEQLAREGE